MRIFPAIDIYQGEVVRLTKGDFATKHVYATDPAEMAMRFQEMGAQYLHVVDLEGAEKRAITNWSTVERLLKVERLQIEVGGGIRQLDEIKRLLDAGAFRVVLGSVAMKQPDLVAQWCTEINPKQLCIGVDVKEGFLVSHGWKDTEPVELHTLVSFLSQQGIQAFLCTDVSVDGTLAGPNIGLYQSLQEQFPQLEWIASGGVKTRAHVDQLAAMNMPSVVIGKAIYEQTLDIQAVLSHYQTEG
jgi:phosphoribosylformimino-5-aminoimidazole carboxamide ribotide isomerase